MYTTLQIMINPVFVRKELVPVNGCTVNRSTVNKGFTVVLSMFSPYKFMITSLNHGLWAGGCVSYVRHSRVRDTASIIDL